uniref:Uncharacterized protein n=1 Tax=Schistocephalus solidus TaxID=70667 RepID=A0A0X3PIL7_SCHSO
MVSSFRSYKVRGITRNRRYQHLVSGCRLTHPRMSILHLIVCRGCLPFKVSSLGPFWSSDHDIVVSALEFETGETFSKKDNFFFEFGSPSRTELTMHLKFHDWYDFFSCQDVNTCSTKLYEVLDPLLSRFVPRKKIIKVRNKVYLPLSFLT